ncbi:MAG TPA: hypothetical protein VMU01_04490 [Rhizomicrobium sp.]|nr:hypothetical protein [Rhizomicrobium sp.]
MNASNAASAATINRFMFNPLSREGSLNRRAPGAIQRVAAAQARLCLSLLRGGSIQQLLLAS